MRQGYDQRCIRAAKDQGLDPVCEVLRETGIAHTIEQTGGFCMAVRVAVPGSEAWYGITAGDRRGYLVCRYADADDTDGKIVARAAKLSKLAWILAGQQK